ncbi:MAG: hypothetical protein H6970_03785 [Gammaproteobacteria bacterium]|nr:hypothetical protein [Gammaproteobacteria bacterium]MCP5424171.1 hypothetical protein [Gammaproteobacteria bacterium]MCP5458952.1 hypothetical protein [Gammaproteobacteria bacterium]
MTMKPFILATAVLLASNILYPTSAFATAWRFLQYSAVEKFSDKDWDLFTAAGEKALNQTPDGETVSWQNPDTSSHGSIKPVNTFEIDGHSCRKVEFTSTAGGFTGHSDFTFCKDPSTGEWKVAQ